MDYRVVKHGEVTVSYTITEYDMDDGTKMYDWVTQSGDDEDQLYESLAEAEAAVRERLGD